MADSDVRDAGRHHHDGPACDECGDTDGVIRHIDIAWPGGRHWEGWLHPECEAVKLARFEGTGEGDVK